LPIPSFASLGSMAKVTDHLWTFDEVYETVINYG
jgi:hypothetical protein